MRREWLKVLFTDISSWQRRNSDNNDRAASELLAAFSMRIKTGQSFLPEITILLTINTFFIIQVREWVYHK